MKKFKGCFVEIKLLYTVEETTKLAAKMTFNNIST